MAPEIDIRKKKTSEQNIILRQAALDRQKREENKSTQPVELQPEDLLQPDDLLQSVINLSIETAKNETAARTSYSNDLLQSQVKDTKRNK